MCAKLNRLTAGLLRLVLALAVGYCTSISAQPTTNVLNIQHWQTSHGSAVYFVQATQLPMLDIQVAFAAGSGRDGSQFGLASLTNSLLNEGAAQLTGLQIADQFDSVGAVYAADTSQDMAVLRLRSLTQPALLNPALTTFSTVLTAPSFTRAAFNRVKKDTITSIRQEFALPDTVAKQAFLAALYADHPYGHLVEGSVESVAHLQPADVKRFYRQYYVASNATIALVGDISTEQAHQIAEQIVQSLPLGEAAKPLAMAQPTTTTVRRTIPFPVSQTTLLLGQIGISPGAPGNFPLLLGNYVLGGSGLVSTLFAELRQKRGLVYGVQSQLVPLAARGVFVIYLKTRNEQAQNALTVARNTLTDFVLHGPTDQQVTAAKNNINGGFLRQFDSNANILRQITYVGFYKLPLDYFDTYRDKVNAVTRQQILDMLQQRIHPHSLVEISVGSAGDAKTQQTVNQPNDKR